MATIQITTSNDAFHPDGAAETARILREAADRIEKGERRFKVLDINGNRAANVRAEDIPSAGSR